MLPDFTEVVVSAVVEAEFGEVEGADDTDLLKGGGHGGHGAERRK